MNQNTVFRFESPSLPGVWMNRYGVVLEKGRMAGPDTRGLVQREALAAGCFRAPDPVDPDVGTVWFAPIES